MDAEKLGAFYLGNEYDSGGDELRAGRWSLCAANHGGRGPQGANMGKMVGSPKMRLL